MSKVVNDEGLDLLFRSARTHNVWLDQPVDDALLRAGLRPGEDGPTSANMCPMRIVFVKSKDSEGETEAGARCRQRGQDHGRSGHSHHRHGHPLLREAAEPVPACGRKRVVQRLAGERARVHRAAKLLASGRVLHAGGRSLGLDCGPMSGFKTQKVDAAFFAGTTVKSNFLCNLGYGDNQALPALAALEASRKHARWSEMRPPAISLRSTRRAARRSPGRDPPESKTGNVAT